MLLKQLELISIEKAEKKGLISIEISKKVFGAKFLPSWTIFAYL